MAATANMMTPERNDERRSSRASLLVSAGIVWTGLYVVLFSFWLALRPAGTVWLLVDEDILRIAGPLLLLPLCLLAVRRWWQGRGDKRGDVLLEGGLPLALGLAVLAFLAGRGMNLAALVVSHRSLASPSPADIPLQLSYVMLLAAVLLLPGRSFSTVSRTRILLDTLLIVSGAAAFSWYFLLGPTTLAEHASVLEKVVQGAYPLWDVVLLCCLLLLFSVTNEPRARKIAAVLTGGLLILVAGDSVREYQVLHGGQSSAAAVDFLRPLAFMLFALAAGMMTLPRGTVKAEVPLSQGVGNMPRVWRYLLPYLSVPAVVALIIYAARTPGDAHLALGVYVAGALLIEVVLLHQYLDYRELTSFASRNAHLESIAAADPVTGLPNHRTLVEELDTEFDRSRRYHHSITVLFMDLDHFKALNDSYGHPAGDAALREFAAVVRSVLRTVDKLGRWGGEEFVAVLPETADIDGMAVAERVRAAVAGHTFWAAGGAHLTCSIGVACYPAHAASRDQLIEHADQAMYVAKRLGRNQVRSAADSAVSALMGEVGPAGAREEATMAGMVEALAALMEARDESAGRHVQQVSALSTRLALELGLDTSEAHLAGMAGRLVDVGKMAVPDAILNKPEQLSLQEWQEVRKHPAIAAAVISRIPKLCVLAPVIRAHHEHWNGAGYPDGLAGEGIPLGARILAVANAYQAMVSERPYRHAFTAQHALAEIERNAGTQFDPRVVFALRRVLEIERQVAVG